LIRPIKVKAQLQRRVSFVRVQPAAQITQLPGKLRLPLGKKKVGEWHTKVINPALVAPVK